MTEEQPTRSGFRALLAGAWLAGMIAAAAPAAATGGGGIGNCTASFVAAHLPHVATSLTVVNAASSPPIAISAAVVPAAGGNPEYCDITGTLVTGYSPGDPGSFGHGTAQFELRLPAVWNSKLVYWGVGGAAGGATADLSANPVDTGEALALGYATSISDTGHEGTLPGAAFNYAVLIDPIVRIDYFYRATHDMTVSVKAFLKEFYGSSPGRAYFDGCSNGGRMAMKEAEQFPDDYDAVIAGSSFINPVTDAAALRIVKAELVPGAWISPAQVPAIDAAVYKYCDGLDGTVDGLIQDPMRCDPAPVLDSLEHFACDGHSAGQCLSPAQIANLRVYWGSLRDVRGNIVFPGQSFTDLAANNEGYPTFSIVDESLFQPTDPAGPEPWGSFTIPPAVPPSSEYWAFVDTMIKFVEDDVSYNSLDFGVTTTPTGGVITSQALALFRSRTGAADANDPLSLVPFLAKGGKIIMYHGLSDPQLSPYSSILFYQGVADLMGGYARAQNQYRLFLEPGMGHCGTGPGPNLFETLSKLDNWVEKGVAPDAIQATKYNNDTPADGVLRTMPLCKYPEMAHYNGTGIVDDATSWSCPSTDTTMSDIGPVGIAAGLTLPR